VLRSYESFARAAFPDRSRQVLWWDHFNGRTLSAQLGVADKILLRYEAERLITWKGILTS
jgi:hypothetical protein